MEKSDDWGIAIEPMKSSCKVWKIKSSWNYWPSSRELWLHLVCLRAGQLRIKIGDVWIIGSVEGASDVEIGIEPKFVIRDEWKGKQVVGLREGNQKKDQRDDQRRLTQQNPWSQNEYWSGGCSIQRCRHETLKPVDNFKQSAHGSGLYIISYTANSSFLKML